MSIYIYLSINIYIDINKYLYIIYFILHKTCISMHNNITHPLEAAPPDVISTSGVEEVVVPLPIVINRDIYKNMNLCLYMYIHICEYIYVFMFIYTCMYIYIYTYICVYI
jgi:hypothetical protein